MIVKVKTNIVYCLFVIQVSAQLVVGQVILTGGKEWDIQGTNSSSDSLSFPCTVSNDKQGVCLPVSQCLGHINNEYIIKAYLEKFPCDSSDGSANEAKICCVIESRDFLPQRCGIQKALASRIFGGEEAELGEFPWMARLIYNKSDVGKHSGCAGFLVHRKFVITAAHCLDQEALNSMGDLIEVHFGEHDTTKEIDCNDRLCAPAVIVKKVKNFVVHPGFQRETFANDIALIQIRKNLRTNRWIRPICLLQYSKFKPGEYTVSGWGLTEDAQPSTVKRRLSVKKYRSHQDCVDKYGKRSINVTTNQICVGGEEGKDSCVGDSGGPLMAEEDGRFYAAGIVSYGISCGEKGWPGIYTNLHSYLEWAKEEMYKRLSESRPKHEI